MKFALLLFLLPLYAPAQTFTLLVVGTDSFYVAPLDTMRYALSLRQAADTTIILDRAQIIERTSATVRLNEAIGEAWKMEEAARVESENLRKEGERLSGLLWTCEDKRRKLLPWARVGKWGTVGIGIGAALFVYQALKP